MAKIRVMQVGIGGYGEEYLKPMLANLPNDRYELVGVVDPVADKSTLYPRLIEQGIPIHATIEAFYESCGADLVIVAAPISFHRQYTVYALEHGSHVLCEKPIAATLQDADAMAESARRTGRFVAIGFQWSFSPAMLAAKRDFLAGEFGKPLQFKARLLWGRDWAYFARNSWAGRLRNDRGDWVLDSVAHNATAHYLHNLYFMQGAALNVSARPLRLQAELYRANGIENFDTCAIRAEMDTGCEALFYATHAVDRHDDPVFEYRYERATLVYNGSDAVPHNTVAALFPDGTVREYGVPSLGTMEKFAACLNAVERGTPLPCGIGTATPHLLTIDFLADRFPIQPFPQGAVVRDAARGRTHVPGLAEALTRCYDTGKLPAEAGVPWAVPAPAETTEGYTAFTGRLFKEA